MSVAYMKGLVGYQTYWLPVCADIRLRNCADPPPKQDIATELVATMRTMGIADQSLTRQFMNTATEIEKNPPHSAWMLAMLSTMYPTHRFFAKDYEKPKVRANNAPDTTLIDNPGGFFDNLPTASKTKKRGRGINFVDKQTVE